MRGNIWSQQTSHPGAMSLDQPAKFVKHQTVTRDAFLGGRLTLSQPGNGFRAGMDSVLLGAAVPLGAESLLDLGAGVGAAGLVALALARAARVQLVERDIEASDLARRNLEDNSLSARGSVLTLDITARASDRRKAGLRDNAHDVVIANPPFFDMGQGTLAPDPSRADARHMQAAALDLWVRCAAASARAAGTVIFIYPVQGMVPLLSAFETRFGALTILPLAPRPATPVTRILVRGRKGSRAPLQLLSTRAMHGSEGHGFAPEFDAIFRGQAALDW